MSNNDKLISHGYEDVVVFENPSFEGALVGVSSDGRAVYSYPLMVESLIKSEGMSLLEAEEWISYNTVRALAYQENAPIVMYTFEE